MSNKLHNKEELHNINPVVDIEHKQYKIMNCWIMLNGTLNEYYKENGSNLGDLFLDYISNNGFGSIPIKLVVNGTNGWHLLHFDEQFPICKGIKYNNEIQKQELICYIIMYCYNNITYPCIQQIRQTLNKIIINDNDENNNKLLLLNKEKLQLMYKQQECKQLVKELNDNELKLMKKLQIIREKKQKLQKIMLQNENILKRKQRGKLLLLWKSPLITLQMFSDLIRTLPLIHKRQIWNRYSTRHCIYINKILPMLHSVMELCIRKNGIHVTPPMIDDTTKILTPFVSIITQRIKYPNGIIKYEFDNKLHEWILQSVNNVNNNAIQNINIPKPNMDNNGFLCRAFSIDIEKQSCKTKCSDTQIEEINQHLVSQVNVIIDDIDGFGSNDDYKIFYCRAENTYRCILLEEQYSIINKDIAANRIKNNMMFTEYKQQIQQTQIFCAKMDELLKVNINAYIGCSDFFINILLVQHRYKLLHLDEMKINAQNRRHKLECQRILEAMKRLHSVTPAMYMSVMVDVLSRFQSNNIQALQKNNDAVYELLHLRKDKLTTIELRCKQLTDKIAYEKRKNVSIQCSVSD
eukprot:195801_1